eukprot:scaffold26066_cov102-Phaeocystis_antarctica.AAC.1
MCGTIRSVMISAAACSMRGTAIVRGVGVYVDLSTDGRAAAAPRRALHLNFGQGDVAYTGVAASSGPVHEALHAGQATGHRAAGG